MNSYLFRIYGLQFTTANLIYMTFFQEKESKLIHSCLSRNQRLQRDV